MAYLDDAYDRIQQIVQGDASTHDVTQYTAELPADVDERGAGTWIDARQTAVTDGRQRHGNHRNQNAGRHAAIAAPAQPTQKGPWSHRRNHDDSIDHHVP